MIGQLKMLNFVRKQIKLKSFQTCQFSKSSTIAKIKEIIKQDQSQNQLTKLFQNLEKENSRKFEQFCTQLKSEKPLNEIIIYNSLMEFYSINFKIEKSNSLIDEMIEKNIHVSPKSYNYFFLNQLKVKVFSYEKLISMFERIKKEKKQTFAIYRTMIILFARNKCINEMEALFKEFNQKFSKDSLVFNEVMKCYCVLNLMEKAVIVFDEMVHLGLKPNNNVFNTLIKGYFHQKNFSKMEEIFTKMNQHQVAPNHLTFIFMLMGATELMNSSTKFDQYRMELKKSNIPLGSTLYSILIRNLLSFGKTKEAMDLFNEMKSLDITPDSQTYEELISFYYDERNLPKMVELANEISKYSSIDEKMNFNIFLILCEEERLSEAEAIFKKLKPNLKGKGAKYLIDLYSKKKDMKVISSLYEELCSDSGVVLQEEVFGLVISTFQSAGEFEKAREVYSHYLESEINKL
jgi:pentatricopeptide repeat protein